MKAITLYLGLDVHKDSITIATAEPGRQGEVRLYGTITHDLHALEKALGRLRKAHPGADMEITYEAGPCGFGIARRSQQLKVPCVVAAPSLIPKQPGAPFKTDQRDARALARLLRAGELTAVYIPEPTDEAIRDLCRARTDAVDDPRRCRLRLKNPPNPVPQRETGVWVTCKQRTNWVLRLHSCRAPSRNVCLPKTHHEALSENTDHITLRTARW